MSDVSPTRHPLAWLPNAISILRIAMTPVIAGLVLVGLNDGIGNYLLLWALGLYIGAALSDWLDGFLARKLNAKSKLGGKLDLLGDKILVGVMIPTLAAGWLLSSSETDPVAALQADWTYLLSAIVIMAATLGRDVYISDLRAKAEQRGFSLSPTFLAKSKTAVLMTGLGLILGGFAFTWYPVLIGGYVMVIAGAVISVITGFDYHKAYQAERVRRRRRKPAPE